MLRLRRRGQSAAARQRAALGKLLTAARGLVCRRTRFLLGRLLTRRSLRSIALAEHLGRAAFAEGDATLRGCHKITSPRRTRGTWYGGARRAAATTRLRLATGLMLPAAAPITSVVPFDMVIPRDASGLPGVW